MNPPEEIPSEVFELFDVIEELARFEGFAMLLKALGLPVQLIAAATHHLRNPHEKVPELIQHWKDPRPEWVRKLAKKFTASFTLVNYAKEKSDGWKHGSAFGVLTSLLSIMRERPERFSKSVPGNLIRPVITTFDAVIGQEVGKRMKGPREDAGNFFSGLAHGMQNPIQASGFPSTGSHRAFLDFALLLLWEEVEKCRTREELYYKLLGDDKKPNQWLGDLETFKRYCGELGILRGKRGRPKKAELHRKTTS